MNQLCKVCGEPAAGFHFGAFTCEGCKSFFGRTYNNISAIAGCKNNGDCVINKKNRTACKACRLRKCLLVGMSKSGSRYGRRSNWFKIHCLLQEQQTHQTPGASGGNHGNSNFEQLARLHQMQARQTYQDKTNPCIKTASMSPTTTPNTTATTASTLHAAAQSTQHSQRSTNPPTNLPPNSLFAAAKFLNGVDSGSNHHHHQSHHHQHQSHQQHHHHSHHQFNFKSETTTRLSDTPSDSGASSAGDAGDDACTTRSSVSVQRTHTNERNCNSAHAQSSAGAGLAGVCYRDDGEERERRRRQLLQIFRSHSEPLKSPFTPFAAITNLPPPTTILNASGDVSTPTNATHIGRPPDVLLKEEIHKRVNEVAVAAAAAAAAAVTTSGDMLTQDEPIDLSFKSLSRYENSHTPHSGHCVEGGGEENCGGDDSSSGAVSAASAAALNEIPLSVIQKKPAPLDLTLVRSQQTLTG